MLLNRLSRFVVCQVALSSTITACLPSGIFMEIWSKCMSIVSVFAAGSTRLAASSLAGHTAPNIYAYSNCC